MDRPTSSAQHTASRRGLRQPPSHVYDDPNALRVEQLERELAAREREVAAKDVQFNALLATLQQVAASVQQVAASVIDSNRTVAELVSKIAEEPRQQSQRGRSLESRRSIQSVYDQTSPADTLPLRVAELTEQAYPTIYKQFKGRSDYDPARWTWSVTENKPYYVSKYPQPRTLFDLKVAVTEVVNDAYGTEDLQRRFNNRNDSSYNSTRPEAVINTVMRELGKQRDTSDNPEEVTLYSAQQTRLEQRTLAQTLNQHVSNIEEIRIVVGQTPSAQSLTLEQYKELYPSDSIVHATRDKFVYFDGLLTVNEMEINTRITTLDQYSEVVTNALAKLAMFDVPIEGDIPPVIYWLQAYYTSVDPATNKQTGLTKVGFWKGRATDIHNMVVEVSTDLPKTLEDLGYDDVRESGSYQLDMSRFVIKRIDLTRSGGGKGKTYTRQETLKKILTERRIQSFHNFTGKYELSWGTIYGVKSTAKNMCFPHALAYHLKEAGMREKVRKTREGNTVRGYSVHDAKRESERLAHYAGSPISIFQACYIANDFGLHCEIYGLDGSLLLSAQASKEPTKQPTNADDRTLRLVLADSHYVNVLAINQKVSAAEPILQAINTTAGHQPCLGYYDIETVNDSRSKVVPYANAYKVGMMIETEVVTTNTPSRTIFESMLREISNHGPGTHHYLSAYNGCNFDHIQLFKYLVEKGVKVINAPNPKGKGQSFTVMLKAPKSDEWKVAEIKSRVGKLSNMPRRNKKEQTEYAKAIESVNKAVNSDVCFITTWDPAMFVRMPLAQAARSFKLELSKGVLDHSKVQAAYTEGRLEEWLIENEEELVTYNKQDVDVLEALTKKLLEVLEKITGYTYDVVIRLPSISALAYKWFMEEMDGVFPVSKEGYDKLIRSALIAGRTEGIVGYHKFAKGAVLIDAVSLYPTAMLNNWYPVGRERVLSTIEEGESAYMEGLLGLYYVEWDQSTMQTPHPLLPTRSKDGRLNWKERGSGSGYLPNITIKQLQQYGAKVTFAMPELTTQVEETKTFNEGDSAIEEFQEQGGRKLVLEKDGSVKVTVWVDKLVTAIVWDKKEMVFKEYVEVLSKIKNEQDEYSRKKDSRYNPALREMVKMMLNAISGKVLQRNFDNHYSFCKGVDEVFKKAVAMFGAIDTDERLIKLVEDYALDVEYVATDVSGNEYGNLLWKMSSFDPKHSKPSHLGIFIYAYSRGYMFDNVFSKMRVWYSDTDSALISVFDYDNLIDGKLKCNDIGRNWQLVNRHDKVFGDYEIESADDGVFMFDAVSVVAPKTYALWSKGKVVKYRCKGIRKSDSFENAEGEVIKIEEHKEEFFELLVSRIGSGEKTKVHTWSFGRKWGKGLGVDYNEIVKEI